MAKKVAVFGCIALSLAACQMVGPESIEAGRVNYNEAIQNTSASQLLTNVARVYLNETPLSLDVQQITAGTSATGSIGGSITGLGIGKKAGAFRMGSLTYGSLMPMLSYSEQPNVTYSPLTGQALVTQFTTPFPVDLISKLYRSSWPLLSILEMMASKLTDNDDDYGMAVNLLTALDQLNALDIAVSASSGPDGAQSKISSQGSKSPPPSPAAQPDGLTLYFIPPRRCEDKGRALEVWKRLLSLYGISAMRLRAGTFTPPVVPPECPIDSAMADTVGAIALDSAAHMPPARDGKLGNQPSIAELRKFRARLETWPAYGLLKGAVDSDYTPAEIIAIVPPALYQQIRREPWNGGTPDRYTLLYRDICGLPNQPFSPRCRKLQATGDRLVNTTIDAMIESHPVSDGPLNAANRDSTYEDNLNQRRRLILIQVSPSAPEDAFLVINRDAKYFYISEDDPTSQRNFALLQLLISVQAVAPTPAPQQSISVGVH